MKESAKEIAKRELAMRVRSRLSLVDYSRLIDVPGRPPSDDPQEWLYHPTPRYGIDDESALIPPIETPLAAHHVLILTVAEKVIKGEIPRAMFFLPPGSAKSTYLSVVTPTWAMGKTPGTKLILASYGSDLAKKHGRRARQIVKSDQYQRTFKTSLSRDTSAADEWALDNESEYMSCGILSGITGHRASGIIVDDPIKGRQEADSDTVRARTWDVYMEDLRTRLLPGGWEIIVQCLAGDTPILMADGTEKRIAEVRAGDVVLSYKGGKHVRRRVLNTKSQGYDDVYEIHAGNRVVKCNERHRWLIQRKNGRREWCKTSNLLNKNGDVKKHIMLVISRAVSDRSGMNKKINEDQAWLLGFMFGDGWITIRNTTQKQRPQYLSKSGELHVYEEREYPRRGYVTCWAHGDKEEIENRVVNLFDALFGVKMKKTSFGYYRTEVASVGRWFIEHGLYGKAKTKRLPPWIYSQPISVRKSFLDGFITADGSKSNGRVATGLCNKDLVEDIQKLARSVGHLPTNIHSYQSIAQPPNSPRPIKVWCHNTSWSIGRDTDDDFSAVYVTKINKAGREEVFDIEVEGDHNFIAGGIVSHNTRWHEDDLAGRILPENYAGESGMIRCRDGRDWYIVCLPAQAERSDDLLGRQKGEYLWPEWFSEEHFRPFKAISRTWSALFQQRPSPETGTYFQRQWFKRYNVLPEHMHLYGSSDYGVTADEHAGSGISGGNSEENSTEHGVLGVAESGDVYLVDAWHGKTTSDVWIEKQLDMVQAHKPFAWFGESGVIRRAVEPFLKRRMQERRAYVREEWIASVADKPTRARALQAWAAQGRVHIPEGMMGDRIIEQLVKFPTSAVDDAVDMLSLFFLALDMAHPAIVQTGTRIKRVSMAEARIDHITKDESMQDEAFIRAEKEYAERYVHRAGEQREYFYDLE